MSMQRSQLFALIQETLSLLSCSTSSLSIEIHVNNQQTDEWETYTIEREPGESTFYMYNEDTVCVAEGSTGMQIMDQLRRLIHRQVQIVVILLNGPLTNSNVDWPAMFLYNVAEEGRVPLPRRRSGNDVSSHFGLLPIGERR